MNARTSKISENKIQSVANNLPKSPDSSMSTFQFVDNRSEVTAHQKLQKAINSSPRVQQLKTLQEMANDSTQVKQLWTYQAITNKVTSPQDHQTESVEKGSLQRKIESVQRKENNTGLSDNLKSGIESLAGFSMDDVNVHYNSDRPAQLQAHAYAQGTDIHLASGQEKHLPHEAWHIVQQKRGKVSPTMQMKGRININYDPSLKKEAGVIGSEASKNISQIQATQLRASHKIEGNVAQLANIQVSFDGTPTQSMFAGPADDLTTTGLANCIAIVAYHTGAPSQGAVMRHYDTVNALVGSIPDAVGGGNALTFNAAAIGAVAAAIAAQLVTNVPAAAGNTEFVVALGGIWSNVAPGTSMWQSRFNLINAIIEGVGVEPVIAAGTVNFDVATSTLS